MEKIEFDTDFINPNYENETSTETKKTTYTESQKKALYRYREKNKQKYCEDQRKLYERLKQNDEWREKRNIKCREANLKYRLKKKQELINKALDEGKDITDLLQKKRGRPRKN